MDRIALIAAAGAFGAVARYQIQVLVNGIAGHPTLWGTFVVNISGAFGLGLFLGLLEGRLDVSPVVRVMLASGFFGAYTTFSTLMFESFDRLEGGDQAAFIFNIAGSLAVGLIATFAGLTLGRAV